MKNRTGFVSNSSTSSFILGLPHAPVDTSDLCRMLFGDKLEVPSQWGDDPIPTISMAHAIESGMYPATMEEVQAMVGRHTYISDDPAVNMIEALSQVGYANAKMKERGLSALFIFTVPDGGDGGNEAERAVCAAARTDFSPDIMIVDLGH